jgi:tetratricopeptide (TPR) repeat protein
MESSKNDPEHPVHPVKKPDPVVPICVALAALTFVVFGQTLKHDFIELDDGDYVYGNPFVVAGLTLKGILWAFIHFHSYNWHPLTWISHMVDCQIFGLHAGGHHFTNVLLHAATVIALFQILRIMTGALWQSAFVAAVFAVHPLRAESVAWVAERKDVLSGLFFMLTVAAYIKYVRLRSEEPRRAMIKQYVVVLLLFACGLMSKPMLVTMPVILLLLDFWPLKGRAGTAPASGVVTVAAARTECTPYQPDLGRAGTPLPAEVAGRDLGSTESRPTGTTSTETTTNWRDWLSLFVEKIPFFALSMGSSIITIFAQRGAIESTAALTLPQRVANAALTCVIYLRQMVWPVRLAPFYPFPHYLIVQKVAIAGVLLCIVSIIAWRMRRRQPWLLTGWVWYLVMLLPVVGILQVGEQAHADRYTYLPQIGICLAITWFVAGLRLPRALLQSAAVGVVLLLAACAWKQTGYWQNSETLARHALAATGDNYMAYSILGTSYLRDGKPADAIPEFENALKLKPGYSEARNNLGNALAREGKLDEAIGYFQAVIKNNPNFADAHYNLGITLGQKGKTNEGIAEFQEAVRVNPRHAAAHNNLGIAFCKEGRINDGALQFKLAVESNPAFFDAYNNLGNALMQEGKVDEAVNCYRQALAINPAYEPAQRNLQRAIMQR